jgi:hypothetical protein
LWEHHITRYGKITEGTDPVKKISRGRKAAAHRLYKKAEYVYAHDVNRWHDMVLVAIDGSKIQLSDDKRLLEKFGGTGHGASAPTAQASLAYDMLNDIIVDAEIEPLAIGEHELAARHMNRVAITPGMGKSLLKVLPPSVRYYDESLINHREPCFMRLPFVCTRVVSANANRLVIL